MQFTLEGKPHLVCCDDAQGMKVNFFKNSEKKILKLLPKFKEKTVYLMTTVSYIAPARYYFIVCSFYSLRFMPKVRLGFMDMYISAALAVGNIWIKFISESIK